MYCDQIKQIFYLLNLYEDNNWFLHSARVILWEEWHFEKKKFYRRLRQKRNKEDWLGFTICTIEVNGKTCNCNRKKKISQNLSWTNRNIFTKYVGHIIIKQTVKIRWKFMVAICCYKIKYEIKLKNWVKINYAYYTFFFKFLVEPVSTCHWCW